MNWERIEGQWNQLKGDLKSKWAKLTDDDLSNIEEAFPKGATVGERYADMSTIDR